jgi:hypothetical protein
MNALTWVGVVVMLAFAMSLVRDIHGNTAGLAERLAKMDTAPASWLERFVAAPWDTIKGTAAGGLKVSKSRPVIDQAAIMAIMPVPTTAQIQADTLTKPADLKTYIDDNVVALNATGKLSAEYPACDPLDDLRKPWLNTKTGQPDIPRCLISKSGDTIWMASVISDGNPYAPRMMSWLGVFHKVGDKWEYRNTDGLGGSAKLPGYKSVNADMIPYQIAADFPYLVAKSEKE